MKKLVFNTMKRLFFTLTVISLSITFASCNKEEDPGKWIEIELANFWKPKKGDVYIAGRVDTKGATVWKNGFAQLITGANAINSILVSNGNVYMAGSEGGLATLWTNGVAQLLSPIESEAHSVFVSGDDVYVTGSEIDRYSTRARLWKNEVAQELPTGVNGFIVYVSGSDVYALGKIYEYDQFYGWYFYCYVLYKNGIEQYRLHKGSITVNSIFVSNGNVYMAGWDAYYHDYYYDSATLWINEEAQRLSLSRSEARSVIVSGYDVYVTGTEGNVARLWKNGVAQELPEGVQPGFRFYVSGRDEYILSSGMLFKNGIEQNLNTKFYNATSIFVVE